jgi:hypothetical protein
MKDKLEIICDGDSWVFGCEIVNPEIAATYPKGTYVGKFDYYENNDSYRVPRIFPTFLSKKLNANVTNLAWPADDNGTILNRTMVHISKEYLAKGKSTENLLVMIGWSSPERNVFYYKDTENKYIQRFRLWPQVKHFDSKAQEEFWKIYVEYLWNAEEYMPRYVMNVLQFQNFCKVHNIKWLCFNSFYQTPTVDIKDWKDLNVRKELENTHSGGGPYHISTDTDDVRKYYQFTYTNLWDTIDPIRFYKKDEENNTFYSFIKKSNLEKPFIGWHPSPEAHEIWADELIQYINENDLLNNTKYKEDNEKFSNMRRFI